MKAFLFIVSLSSLSFFTYVANADFTTIVQNSEKEILIADSFGKTLYTFDLDINSPKSKCIGDCAEVWPPYIVTADEAAKLTAPLAATPRANNKLQLTYDGHLVYTYIFDRHSGDDLGDGIGGVWHYVKLNNSCAEPEKK